MKKTIRYITTFLLITITFLSCASLDTDYWDYYPDTSKEYKINTIISINPNSTLHKGDTIGIFSNIEDQFTALKFERTMADELNKIGINAFAVRDKYYANFANMDTNIDLFMENLLLDMVMANDQNLLQIDVQSWSGYSFGIFDIKVKTELFSLELDDSIGTSKLSTYSEGGLNESNTVDKNYHIEQAINAISVSIAEQIYSVISD